MSLVRGSGGGGTPRLIRKQTNGQPAVFTSAGNAQTYFQANQDDADKLLSGSYAVGIGPVAELYPSDSNTYYVYNTSTLQYEIALGLQGPEGEPGPPGSTPEVIVDTINQAAHGFTQADVDQGLGLKCNNFVWSAGSNDVLENLPRAMLAEIIDANNFRMIMIGAANRPNHGFPSDIYYVDSNGRPTDTPPAVGYVMTMFSVSDPDNIIVNFDVQSTTEEHIPPEYHAAAKHVAVRDGLSDGDVLSGRQLGEILQGTFGNGITINRGQFKYYEDADTCGIYNDTGGQDPTNVGHTYSIIQVPSELIEGESVLDLIAKDEPSSLTKEMRLWNGDPTVVGLAGEISVVGVNNGTSNHEMMYNMPVNSQDIYICFSRQRLVSPKVMSLRPTALAKAVGQAIGDNRVGSRAIKHDDDTQVVYVSNTGNDAWSGRTPSEAKATIAAAQTTALALPATSKRAVVCVNASVFNENITPTAPLDFYMPNAALIGNISTSSTDSRTHINLAVVQGTVSVTNGDHFTLQQVAGNMIIGDCSIASALVICEDWVSGSVTSTSAAGSVCFDISHNDAGLIIPTGVTGFTPYGRVGETVIGVVNEVVAGANVSIGGTTENPVINAAGGLPTEHTTVGLIPNGQRFVIATIDPVAASDPAANYVIDFDFIASDANGSVAVNSNTIIRGIAGGGVADVPSFITYRDSQYPLNKTGVTYALWRVSSDLNDGYIVTVDLEYDAAYDVTIRENRSSALYPNVTYATQLTPHTPGAEVLVKSLDLNQWQGLDVGMGIDGGLALKSVGDYEGATGAHTKFENGQVVHYASGSDIQVLSAIGTQFSSGAYSTSVGWPVFPTTDFPTDAVFFETLVAQKRPNQDDVSLNPSSTITLTGIDGGGVVAQSMSGFDGAHQGLRFNTIGSGGLDLTFAGCLFQRVRFKMYFGSATSSSTTQDYEIVDADGAVLYEFQIPDTNNDPGSKNDFTFEFDGRRGDFQVTLRKASSGTGQVVYLYDYEINVFVDRPPLRPNTCAQFDDPHRGISPPRNFKNDIRERGLFGCDALNRDRPYHDDGFDWAYFHLSRVIRVPISYGLFAFARPEAGPLDSQGWSYNTPIPLVTAFGFTDGLFHLDGSQGDHIISSTTNPDALWEDVGQRSLGFDYPFIHVAGYQTFNIEPKNVGFFASNTGRWGAYIDENAGNCRIQVESAGALAAWTTTTLSEKHVISVYPTIPVDGTATIILDKDESTALTIDIAGNFNGQRGMFMFSNDNTLDHYFQSIALQVLEAGADDLLLDRESIRTGADITIPNVPNAGTLRLPKDLYDFQETIVVSNGARSTWRIEGETADLITFQGAKFVDIEPGQSLILRCSSNPAGTEFSVGGGSGPAEAGANTVFLTVDSNGVILFRSPEGTYKGPLSDLTPVQTGQFSFGAGTFNFDFTNSWADATCISNSGQKMTATCTISNDRIFIDVTDKDENRVSDRFYFQAHWVD